MTPSEAWEDEKDNDSPTLCHQCSNDIELGDFDLDTGVLKFYFEDE
jgi:hypothetical protein